MIHLEGDGALRFLHGQTSQALELARPGQCLPTCCITPTARLRGLAEVLVEDGGAWLLISSGDGPSLHQALDRVLFPADQVVLGPLQPARLVSVLAEGSWRSLGDGPGTGWELDVTKRLLLPADQPIPAWLEALPELSSEDRERWRLQRGEPALPAEINDDLNPFELGLADRVSLSKGCYVGQETLAKLATYDGVKQQLRRWAWVPGPDQPGAAAEAPAAGTSLFSANGERAGRITSCLELPAAGTQPRQLIGLALVRRQFLAEGTLLAGGLPLVISTPSGFRPPPVGTGGSAVGRS